MVEAKICGLSTPETVRAALDGGAGRLGFVLFEKSPRHVTLDAAAALARPVRGRARIVALLVDPSDAMVEQTARVLAPDEIQLHGKESPARAREIGQRAGASVIKALPIFDAADLARAREFETAVDHLMFDAKPPIDAERPGGHGGAFDWAVLSGERFARPWFLAGGLDPWNVGEAIRVTGAPMVDVSSGVERGAGIKDPALIAAFLGAVRRA